MSEGMGYGAGFGVVGRLILYGRITDPSDKGSLPKKKKDISKDFLQV